MAESGSGEVSPRKGNLPPEQAMARVRDVFARVPRPERMGRGTCCCSECAEHEALLSSFTPQTIAAEQLGTPASDPICFANDQAFAYYMPAMVRLCFSDGYIDQFLFHINVPGRVDSLTREQAEALLDCMWSLAEHNAEQIAAWNEEYRMEEAIKRLEERIAFEKLREELGE